MWRRSREATLADGARAVVVTSDARHRRERAGTAELVANFETKLLALENRIRGKWLKDPAKIGRAVQRILGPSGVTYAVIPTNSSTSSPDSGP